MSEVCFLHGIDTSCIGIARLNKEEEVDPKIMTNEFKQISNKGTWAR